MYYFEWLLNRSVSQPAFYKRIFMRIFDMRIALIPVLRTAKLFIKAEPFIRRFTFNAKRSTPCVMAQITPFVHEGCELGVICLPFEGRIGLGHWASVSGSSQPIMAA